MSEQNQWGFQALQKNVNATNVHWHLVCKSKNSYH